MKNIGKILKEARTAAGINQREAAKILGVDPAALSRIETGKQIPRWTFVETALQRLDIQLDDYEERGRSYRIDPKYSETYDIVINGFLTLPEKERKHLVGELVNAI